MDVDATEAVEAPADASETVEAMISVSPARAIKMAELIVLLCKNTPLELHPETFSVAAETATMMSRFRVSAVNAASKKKKNSAGNKRRTEDADDLDMCASITSDDAQRIRAHGYSALYHLVNSKHGDINASITTVFRTVSANIIGAFPMMFLPATSNSSSGRDFSDIRNSAIDLVLRLVSEAKESAQIIDAVSTLLQHLCMRVPDKAELRHGASQAVISILLAMRPQEIHRFVTFIDKYGRNQKPAYRIFAVELSEKILTSKEVNSEDEMNLVSAGGVSLLIATIVQRCADKVRCAACSFRVS